jgi:mitochondrial enoyl-[acyl-carrier protein] reductase / trans-2-enoyl-CoA reductase
VKQVECIATGSEPWACVAVVEREPEPCGPGQVQIAVRARPIDPADLLLLNGRHVYRPELPAVVGIEGAGVVVAVGPGVEELEIGIKVAIPRGGTWREVMTMPAAELIALPADADLVQASMLPVNPFTAAGLLEGVAAGSWIIQNAATSAVARIITRMAHQRGIHSISVVRSTTRMDELAALGADHVLVDGADLVERVRAAVGDVRIGRALDAVAGEAAGRLLGCISDGGELITYGLLGDDQVRLPAAQVVFRDVTIRGFSRLRGYAAMPAARREAIARELIAMARAGELATEVEATYPLVHVAEALRHQLRPDRRGKIVLTSE